MTTRAARRVLDTVKAMFAAYEKRDAELTLSYFLPEPEVGTDSAGPSALRDELRHAGSVHVRFVRTRTEVRDHAARLTADCRFVLKLPDGTRTVPAQLCAFLEEQDGRWLIRRGADSPPFGWGISSAPCHPPWREDSQKKTGRKTCP